MATPSSKEQVYAPYLKQMKTQITTDCENRSLDYLDADLACVQAIAQAAVNVELFTIPLYMTSLYSIKGTHQINSEGSTLYTGRWWPGTAPTAGKTLTTNQQVFNKVYSVFIEEMLHLQLAANMSSKLGFTPVFTSNALQTDNYGWHCYAKDNTTIPHILDFTDWKGRHPDLSTMTVELRAMNETQVELFLAIEETAALAATNLHNPDIPLPDGGSRPKYFEPAPFDWFTASMTENNLPLFGSIGHMYLCYWSYLEIKYDDGSTLLERLTNVQRDQFNNVPERPEAQYPGINGTLSSTDLLKCELINNIDAITDQGEGDAVVPNILEVWGHQPWATLYRQKSAEVATGMLGAVQSKYQPDPVALAADYPGYNDVGKPTEEMSGSAQARSDAANKDHYELFAEVKALLSHSDYMTWDTWHQQGNSWTSAMLGTNDAQNLPSTQDVAQALNNLISTEEIKASTYDTFSQSAVGTIKGITTQLNAYWRDPSVFFPGPAMGGSGDRVSICWAVTGEVPDLVTGIVSQDTKAMLYHACQGMDLTPDAVSDPDSCAAKLAYHSCKGSNECKTQGGCGFVQSASGGGSCSGTAAKGIKSAPADNLCSNLGGCAVPISASQLFPKQTDDCYEMQLYKFGGAPDFKATPISWLKLHARDMLPPVVKEVETMPYKVGDSVYDVAWKAYCTAAGLVKVKGNQLEHHRSIEMPTQPEPSDIRLALPPST
ncbi:ferritin-like protein [Shewanella sp. YLB-07]|uniref:ferritin-like protein n=1 Tax=Shewanella sp. YLB-07 TaxID=2601268 RepID=UPI001D13520A|nr:ferritin-like protein [Shewanella sp. YLB-07]